MLAYSPDTERGRAYLLRRYNDIDLYVEDVNAQNLYVRLFGRILEGIATINNVYPLQNRQNVLAACAADVTRGGRKRLYVIHADFDLLQGIPAPSMARLYRLGVYCSENLVLSEFAAVEIAMECSTNRDWHDLALALDCRTLFERALSLLTPLFVVYAIAELTNVGIATSGYHVQKLFDTQGQPQSLSPVRIRRRMAEVRAAILDQIDMSRYRRLRQHISARVGNDTLQQARYLSGKTYLLPILFSHLIREVGFRGDPDSLKVRLASKCELTIDPGLVNALIAAAV